MGYSGIQILTVHGALQNPAMILNLGDSLEIGDLNKVVIQKLESGQNIQIRSY